MTIFNEINTGFRSLGDWISEKAGIFSNKVIQPIFNKITRPIRVIDNIGTGVENASFVWKERAGNLTNDVIKGLDNTFTGIGNMFKTPIIPIALGLGAVYIFKK